MAQQITNKYGYQQSANQQAGQQGQRADDPPRATPRTRRSKVVRATNNGKRISGRT